MLVFYTCALYRMILTMMILMIIVMTMIIAITTTTIAIMIGLQYTIAKNLCTYIVQCLVAAKKPRPPVNFDLLGHKVRSNLVFWISLGGDE